jgi:hypothetical protein
MLVTLSEIATLVKFVQLENVSPQIVVTLLGMVILIKFLQFLNAELPMFVTLNVKPL